MKMDPQNDGAIIINSTGVGTVTRKMVRERAVELALINGRSAQDVSKSDCEQAKRELTGKPEMDPREEILESAPESERWNPLPGSAGSEAPMSSSDEEDDDGRSIGEILIEEGLNEAGHDQMLKAVRAEKQDQEP